MEEKQLEHQKNRLTPAGYTKRMAWNAKTNRNKTTKTPRNFTLNFTRAKNLLELTNRDQIRENENAFLENMIWGQ